MRILFLSYALKCRVCVLKEASDPEFSKKELQLENNLLFSISTLSTNKAPVHFICLKDKLSNLVENAATRDICFCLFILLWELRK